MPQDRKPNVLFITRRFPPSVGGMERFAFDLTEAIRPKVNLYLIKWSGKNRYISILLVPWFFVRACWILLTNKIDIVHMQDGVFAIWGLVLKYVFRKPMTVVIHGLDVTHKGRLYQFLVPKALKKADHVFCISNMAAYEVVKRGVSESKVSFEPLGITDDFFMNNKTTARQKIISQLKLRTDTKIILSAGRLVKRKGVAWFINNVMPDLIKANDNIVLVVSGDGPEKSTIEEAIKINGLKKHIFLLGRTSHDMLQNLYNGSDVFIMPNIKVEGDREGFGRVLLEAALCELPVVATGIEGIVDAVIGGKNGTLVQEKDTKAYVVRLTTLLKDDSLAKKTGKAAREYTLKNFDWDSISNKYLAEYKKLS